MAVGTSIQPIYLQHPAALATSASYLHEIAEGRFRLGVGVTHGPVIERLGVETGKPLSDMREYVATMRTAAEHMGGLPPVVLATLRDKMVALSVEVGNGAVWANGSLSRMGHSVGLVPADRRADGFWIGNMTPTVIDDDLEAARARNRTTLQGYVALPNYRNYWIDAGYQTEMHAAKAAIDAGDTDALQAAMSDAWLDDCTLSGPAGRVRDGIEAWFDAGVTPIVVPSSTSGGQAKAVAELFDAFA
jgi:alkanesulfonate monooxygenase SsuD/methylene tetrahydromethanopterin reductase-like flavin-dependent oxidoreductase (luciferase family)